MLRTDTHTHMHARTRTHTHTHMHACAQTHTHTHAVAATGRLFCLFWKVVGLLILKMHSEKVGFKFGFDRSLLSRVFI